MMLPSGSRSRASRHIQGWLRGPCSNVTAASGELLDSLVEVVAFEIDGGGGDDLFVGIDLDRQSDAARGFEASVAGLGTVDDLAQAELSIEIDRAPIIGAGDGDLVKP